jgi:heptaprenyl diphosphate synthase
LRDKNARKVNIHSLAVKSLFLGLALIVGIVERWIPFEFAVPGVKLGLANAVVLTALYLLPWRSALEIALFKCVMVAIFAGTGVSFLYSLGGTILSFTAMALLIRIGRGKISPIGVSVMGAAFHNIGQILVASLVLQTFMIVAYLPILLVSGVITGIIVGIIVKVAAGRLSRLSLAAYHNASRCDIMDWKGIQPSRERALPQGAGRAEARKGRRVKP